MDSLLSTAQMPQGVPVACVAVDGAVNAGILAAQILAVGDNQLSQKVKAYKARISAVVLTKDKTLFRGATATA